MIPYKLTDEQVIANIIRAFQGFALDDIKFNQGRPIAAGILIACLLDQMGAFFFKEKQATHRAQKFVNKYLPKYKAIKLFDIMRSPLIHHYSLMGKNSLTSDVHLAEKGIAVSEDGIISIPALIQDLDEGINRAVLDLRENEDVRKYALKWHETHRVLALHQIALYSYEKVAQLWEAYRPLFEQHPKNVERHLTISFESRVMAEDRHALYVVVVDHDQDTMLKLLFNDYISLLELPSPGDLLGGKNEEGMPSQEAG